jgi:hypothetical protein
VSLEGKNHVLLPGDPGIDLFFEEMDRFLRS